MKQSKLQRFSNLKAFHVNDKRFFWNNSDIQRFFFFGYKLLSYLLTYNFTITNNWKPFFLCLQFLNPSTIKYK
jgi:hypothetical protein